ncbi:lysine decarboxylase [Sinorhizobium fredii USDA 205]|uniref:Cytokinin riboside 5'-monophosphate phosphoribohydrolase n=3 Tax=Rhizobium fredii TaxID=380 RepID=A0A844A2N4_RHIFR|nr:TIGR00730 family Rossman fold protein [Sinorhizobium fredii]AWI56492.1 hypothetical protein AB395_0000815 [Sinorhizobium fredii CCBAU 45436]AWM24284.1 Lysine decarboxylase family [Sinorhizobium fredii CCBAU 25509]KSV81476.1 lysine decarboxylase [Sinorhizobium fredii USDA 205]MCG5473935.1 TIGR00730 family Rossman fold protein [Sinorhizobium fredii]MQW96806.1 TIGR00730 family Rossman fold protein [Sinorhizobium fredii]
MLRCNVFFAFMIKHPAPIRSVCVYCGSQPGRDPAHIEAGRLLGKSIADHGLQLVYGGGTRGIMGAVASGVLSAGGHVTGIIPEFLMDKEATRHSLGQLNELIVTGDMHERKHTMFERADAFIALPGGIGTLEEIVEIMTWAQLGRHRKPMVFGNINGFWAPMLELLTHMREQGFVHTAHLVQPLVIDRVEDIVPGILATAAANDREGATEIISRL